MGVCDPETVSLWDPLINLCSLCKTGCSAASRPSLKSCCPVTSSFSTIPSSWYLVWHIYGCCSAFSLTFFYERRIYLYVPSNDFVSMSSHCCFSQKFLCIPSWDSLNFSTSHFDGNQTQEKVLLGSCCLQVLRLGDVEGNNSSLKKKDQTLSAFLLTLETNPLLWIMTILKSSSWSCLSKTCWDVEMVVQHFRTGAGGETSVCGYLCWEWSDLLVSTLGGCRTDRIDALKTTERKRLHAKSSSGGLRQKEGWLVCTSRKMERRKGTGEESVRRGPKVYMCVYTCASLHMSVCTWRDPTEEGNILLKNK